MCCGGMSNPFAYAIAFLLEPGDEVIVSGKDSKGGEHKDEIMVVYQINDFSFLTTSVSDLVVSF